MRSWMYLIIGLSQLALLAFLAFWLVSSYQETYDNMKNEVHLEIARDVLRGVDIDLFSLFGSDVNFNISQSANVSVYVSADTTKQSLPSIPPDGPQKSVMKFSESDTVALAFVDPAGITNDTTSIDENQIQTELKAALAALPRRALTDTIPEFLIALFLLLLSTAALWTLHRYHKRERLQLAAKNAFLSNMAHELRTPLTTVGVALEAIQDFSVIDDPDHANQYLRTARRELGNFSVLVERVLEVARGKQAPYRYERKSTILSDLVASVLESKKAQIEAQGATVKHLIPANLMIQTDPVHLRQVLSNLVDNALKYSTNGVKIQISTEVIRGHLHLHVSDTGIGIPKAYREQVFEQFFRVPTANVHNVKGFGLGLHYVRQVVEHQGGRVELQSTPGQGTTVSIQLPQEHGNAN